MTVNVLNIQAIGQRSAGKFPIVVDILQVYNVRAGEVLSATWQNFFPGRFLILKAEKKSCDIIVRDRNILASIEALEKDHPTFIFYGVSYQKLYYYIKKNLSHLFNQPNKKGNMKITHYFRYANVRGIEDMSAVQTILYHKTLDSGVYYKTQSKEQ